MLTKASGSLESTVPDLFCSCSWILFFFFSSCSWFLAWAPMAWSRHQLGMYKHPSPHGETCSVLFLISSPLSTNTTKRQNGGGGEWWVWVFWEGRLSSLLAVVVLVLVPWYSVVSGWFGQPLRACSKRLGFFRQRSGV